MSIIPAPEMFNSAECCSGEMPSADVSLWAQVGGARVTSPQPAQRRLSEQAGLAVTRGGGWWSGTPLPLRRTQQ
jgi:hypothetical protein